MKNNKLADDFWLNKIEPVMVDSNNFKQVLMKRERDMFRKNRSNLYYEEKMKIAKKVVENIKKIPWILMVAVTGSVATEWPKKDDDIDFMVVCLDKRLWLCRFLILYQLRIGGFDIRNFSKTKENSLCFNLWIEENSMEIEKERQNMLTALEIVWMKPLLNRDKCLANFLIKNKWIKKYVKIKSRKFIKNELNANNWWLNSINMFLYILQYVYMRKKINKEIVGKNKAYFHPKGGMQFDRI